MPKKAGNRPKRGMDVRAVEVTVTVAVAMVVAVAVAVDADS